MKIVLRIEEYEVTVEKEFTTFCDLLENAVEALFKIAPQFNRGKK